MQELWRDRYLVVVASAQLIHLSEGKDVVRRGPAGHVAVQGGGTHTRPFLFEKGRCVTPW